VPTMDDYLNRPARSGRRSGGRRTLNQEVFATADGPRISIVTVVRNNAKTIRRAIESVLNQSYTNIEYIVIDGGSTDGTLEIIQEFNDRLALWISEPDDGIFDAMNKGVSLTGGDYVALLNSDDYYRSDAIQKVAIAIEMTRPDVVYGDYIFVADDVQIEVPTPATVDLLGGMTLGHPAMFVSRQTYQRLGLYDLRYSLSADFDLALRLYLAGCRFEKVPGLIAYFTSGGAAESNLTRASLEAITVLRRQAGILKTFRYVLMFVRRTILRGISTLVRVSFGVRAQLALRRRYYGRLSAARAHMRSQ
jgi:GT2 family glycosyltransferase